MPWVQLTEFKGFFENVTRLQTLQLVPNLVKCTLHCDAWNSQFHSSVALHVPKVHFSKLLFLRLNIAGIPTDLFNHLEVPILCAIHINGIIKHSPWISGQPFISFLSRCSDTLHSLSLKGPSDMNRCLDAIASPTRLTVVDFHECVASDILGQLVFPLPGAKLGSCLLPELEVLKLGGTTKNLQLLADVIQSRLVGSDMGSMARLSKVRFGLPKYDGDDSGFPNVDPQIAARLRSCRTKGVDISFI